MNKIPIAGVVDDDPIYVSAVKRVMERANFAEKTLFFANGRLALDFFVTCINDEINMPDVILLDLNMPVLDGWQFMGKFIQLKPSIAKKITVYIVSSSISEEDHERARALEGVSDFIIKPLSVEKLHDILREMNEGQSLN